MPRISYLIHWESANGVPDSIYLTGDSIEEIRERAQFEVESRNGKNAWSEEVAPSTVYP